MSDHQKHEIQYEKKHETRRCPRCEVEFECKSGSILLCQCQTIFLSQEQMEYIGAQYDDCLCVSCLGVLRSEYNCRQFEKRLRDYRR